MPGGTWTTPDQASWLRKQVPRYLNAKANKSVSDFFNTVSFEFFSKWSEKDHLFPPQNGSERVLTAVQQLELTNAIEKRKTVSFKHSYSIRITYVTLQQIKAWLGWHSRNHTARGGLEVVSANFANTFKQLARTRPLKDLEVYSQIYYKTKIKPMVIAKRGTRTLSRSDNLKLVKQTIADCWAAETEDIKAAVRIRASQLRRDRESVIGSVPKPNQAMTPEDYQKYVLSIIIYILIADLDILVLSRLLPQSWPPLRSSLPKRWDG